MNIPESRNVRNILIVQMSNHIGDTICGLPMYAALREQYPRAEITLVAAVKPYAIPLRDLNPFLDHVLYHDKRSIGTLARFLAALRNRTYDIGIVPPSILCSRTAHIINRLSGARVRVGADSLDGVPNPMRRLLNVRTAFHWDRDAVPQPERHLDMVRLLGAYVSPQAHDAARFRMTDDDARAAQRFLRESFSASGAPIIVVHPGAGKRPNIWDPSNFGALARRLHEACGVNVVISAGADDTGVVDRLTSECAGIPFALLSGPYRLIAGVLSAAQLLVTNDTGVMHIGGSVGVRMVTVHGPSKAYEWAPRGGHIRSIQSPTTCIDDITVDEVFTACQALLEV
jgi:ADP-heptose:LPS heptosyltransferase